MHNLKSFISDQQTHFKDWLNKKEQEFYNVLNKNVSSNLIKTEVCFCYWNIIMI